MGDISHLSGTVGAAMGCLSGVSAIAVSQKFGEWIHLILHNS